MSRPIRLTNVRIEPFILGMARTNAVGVRAAKQRF
jgi:hypothetical protein